MTLPTPRPAAAPGPAPAGRRPAAPGDAVSARLHRALAGASRSRILAHLRAADAARGVGELAVSVGLHPNTVRQHLDELVAVGLVRRETAPPRGRGRPGLRYAAARETATAAAGGPERALAAALAGELGQRRGGPAIALAAGERWGRSLAGGTAASAADSLARLLEVLDGAGFSPEAVAPPRAAGPSIRLRSCPFGTLAVEHGVVCQVHLGLMRGVLRELGGNLETSSLEPFAEPDACLARLAEGGSAA